MIEFVCEYCETMISLSLEQSNDIICCPSCNKEIIPPALDPENKSLLTIKLAQMKNKDSIVFDSQKIRKIFKEPASKEATEWKNALSSSFKEALPAKESSGASTHK